MNNQAGFLENIYFDRELILQGLVPIEETDFYLEPVALNSQGLQLRIKAEIETVEAIYYFPFSPFEQEFPLNFLPRNVETFCLDVATSRINIQDESELSNILASLLANISVLIVRMADNGGISFTIFMPSIRLTLRVVPDYIPPFIFHSVPEEIIFEKSRFLC